MPGFDGTGPQGKGPMTGRGLGFCVLQESKDKPGQVEGLAGIQGTPIGAPRNKQSKERQVFNMPRGNGTGPTGFGPMTGRAAGFCAGYAVPGYMNPVGGRAGYYGYGAAAAGPYGAGPYGYGMPYSGVPWYGGGFARFGFGRGRGRGWGFRSGRRGFGRW